MLIPRSLSDLRTPSERFYGAAVVGEGLPQEDRLDFLGEASRTFDRDRNVILGRNMAVGGLSGGFVGLALSANPNIAERAFSLIDRATSSVLQGRAGSRLVDTLNHTSEYLDKANPGSVTSPHTVASRIPVGEVLKTAPTDPSRLDALRSLKALNETTGPQTRRDAVRSAYKELLRGGPDPLVSGDLHKAEEVFAGLAKKINTDLPAPKVMLSSDAAAVQRALSGGASDSVGGWQRVADQIREAVPEDTPGRAGASRRRFLSAADDLVAYNATKENIINPLLGKLKSFQNKVTPLQKRLGLAGTIGAGAALAAAKTIPKLKGADELLSSSREAQREYLLSRVRLPGQGADFLSEAPNEASADGLARNLVEPVVNFFELVS